MLSEKLQKALNEQVNNELFAAYQYLAMAEYFHARNLDGFAHWMRLQRQEEIGHAMKIFDFILERDGRVKLAAIAAPAAKFTSSLDVLKKALEHERKVTEGINELYAAAKKENDYPTEALMQWFVLEQVEEEASALKVVERLEMAGDDKAALLMLDREMGQRTATA
ncbi:MAG TPA: ferritin [Gemmatimonadota bacterium]|nr:ferritin [Gemmatimonadota bacterium]